MKLGSCKSALNPPMVYSTDRSKAVVPLLILLFVFSVVYSTRRSVLCLTLCYFVLVFFSPFNIAVTSLGEERELILVLFIRSFDLCLFGFCRFPVPLGVWDELRFVIVALPELFLLLFFNALKSHSFLSSLVLMVYFTIV